MKYPHCFFFTRVHTISLEYNMGSVIKIHQMICVGSRKYLRVRLCRDVDNIFALVGYYAK
jgi:hypothetical protein